MAELKLKARADPSFPSHNVFSRLGRKAKLAAKVVDYCKTHPGFEDVKALCEPLLELPSRARPPSAARDEVVLGEVYLMKVGGFYKIGRSTSTGRREYEVGLKLPEKPKTLHTIETDDPVGIEAYWHQRFADRRKRGEWFHLSAQDVAAFKRRRFM